MSDSKGTLAFSILFCMVALTVSGFTYYPMVNAILAKFGIDGLSFFQMSLCFSFLHFFTNRPDSLFARAFFKAHEKSLSDEEKAGVYVTVGIRTLIQTLITWLIYTYLIVPKFF
jgi:hypothetical protein